jgi:hypothetical protein
VCPRDGIRLIADDGLVPGSMVREKYRIIRKLGQGGMGVVFLAEDTLLGVPMALKFLAGDLSSDPGSIQRLRDEARAAFQLRSGNIVEVTALDQDESGKLFIAMRYVEGPDLRDVIEGLGGPMAIERAMALVGGIASGLAAAHSSHIVHRDIKPENILIESLPGRPERPKILDFGIAAILDGDSHRIATRRFVLSPRYAAPEQFEGMRAAEFDGRTDLYALGGIFYELLTGRTPYEAESLEGWLRQHLQGEIVPPSQLRPEIARFSGLEELVLCLLARDRGQRPTDAFEVMDRLNAIGGRPASATMRETVVELPAEAWTGSIEPNAPNVPNVATGSRWFRPRMVVGLAALLLACAASAFWLFGHKAAAGGVRDNAVQSLGHQAGQSAASLYQQAWNLDQQKEFSRAAEFYRQACEAGDNPSCLNLGIDYSTGNGVLPDQGQAADYFRKACEGGNAAGCYNLGVDYHQGAGVGKNDAQAASLFRKGCEGGNADACANLGVFYNAGIGGLDPNLTQASAFYRKACDGGSAIGCSNLGNLFWTGDGVARDRVQAESLLRKGCKLGNQWGCKRIKQLLAGSSS